MRILKLSLTFFILLFISSVAQAQIKASVGTDKPLPNKTPKLTKKLSLSGARGETLGFFINVGGKKSQKLSLSGSIANNFVFKFFKPHKMQVTKATKSYKKSVVGTYLDPLVPFNVPAKINPKNDAWIFAEVKIPDTMKPGTYKGKIKFGSNKLSVNLKVWKMVMPKVPTLPLYGVISPVNVQAGHYGVFEWDFSRINMGLYRNYIRLLAEHHVYPLHSWPYDELKTPIVKDGKSVLDVFDHPNASNSYKNNLVNTLPQGMYYDFPAPRYGKDQWADIKDINDVPLFEGYFRAMQNTPAALNRPGKAMTFLWDEPFMNSWMWKSEADAMKDLNLVLKYTTKAKAWAPNVKIMLTTPCFRGLEGSVDIFTTAPNDLYEHNFIGGTAADCDYLRQRGSEIWWYVSCMSHGCTEDTNPDNPGTPDFVFDRDSTYIRSIGWLQKMYNFKAFMYFDLVYAYEMYATARQDPWKTTYYFSGNGDGTMLYPGRPGQNGVTSHQPIASLRLKEWRETSFDAEYINWMSKSPNKPSWWEKDYKKLITNAKKWKKNYAAYQNLRNKIGDYLNKH